MSDELILEIDPPYIGSAVSPTVDITETTTDVTVTITDFQGEHAYTIDKTDQAIADAEQAATNANTAASQATATANAAAQYARDTADQAAADAQATADAAAGRADTAAASATSAAQAANTAASTANTAAQNADAKAALADSKAALANQAATTANTAAQAAEAAKTAATTAAGQATTAAGNANTAAGTANTAASNADAKAALADTAAANADTATANANTATTAANNAAQAANNAADVATEAAETITDGYFPRMLAGAAEALMGETDTATFAERVSTHDGVARIESIQGNTVAWNQLAPANDFSSLSTGAFVSGTRMNAGSKYLLSFNPVITVEGSNDPRLYLYYNDSEGGSTAYSMHAGKGIFTATKSSVSNGTTSSVPSNMWFYIQKFGATMTAQIMLFDLTRMFGAGNEPATVAEFERMFPDDYYPYSAGELLSVNIEGVNDREIPVSTYFPDGMKSAGSIHDELTMSKAVKRVGVVDMGTLVWNYETTRQFMYGRFYADKNQMPKPDTRNLLSEAFSTESYITSDGNYVRVFGTGYTDPATFKTAVTGMLLYYELATPVETEITPPLTMTYTVEQGGTESIVIPTGEQSAAPTMAIVYSVTIDGVVDKALSVIAPIEGATASTNYSVNAYLVHNQQLYRVTSAIATGEAITPGTNCVACTVMGEVIRLTA